MKRVAILIPGSPNAGFFSQVAAFSRALRGLPWSRWQPTIHLYLGGDLDPATFAHWRQHLRDVEIVWVSDTLYAKQETWAQSDAVFRMAPRGPDVFLAMDADTLPVAGFEDALDRVAESGGVAGLIAHYPFPDRPGTDPKLNWDRVTKGLISKPVGFDYEYTLVSPKVAEWGRRAPFYLNFGVVFFARAAFNNIANRYLNIRQKLMPRMHMPDFSGQVALTLAIEESGAPKWALPMRYNFPNDPVAAERYPQELENVVIFHYLRTKHFDRQVLFTTAQSYSSFLGLTLSGSDLRFQTAVRRLVGESYPFS